MSLVSFACPSSQQLCDPEVQQPDLAIGGDQNIRRLQIPMHDELRVRVGDGIRDLRKQLQPRLQIDLLVAAVLVDLMSFDVLDREKRLPLRGEARVVQACDIRMSERREDFTLARHPLRQSRALPCPVRKLQRDRPIDEPVAALRQPHRAHAAAAQLAHQAIGSDRVARLIATAAGVRRHPAHHRSNFGRVLRKSLSPVCPARESRSRKRGLSAAYCGASISIH